MHIKLIFYQGTVRNCFTKLCDGLPAYSMLKVNKKSLFDNCELFLSFLLLRVSKSLSAISMIQLG